MTGLMVMMRMSCQPKVFCIFFGDHFMWWPALQSALRPSAGGQRPALPRCCISKLPVASTSSTHP